MSQQPNIIPAAIKTRHTVEFKTVPTESEPIQPQIIEVDASILPLTIRFKSASSNLKVLQTHIGGGGDTQETSSEDEPQKLVHVVTKPVYQEIREIITPYRKVIQEIRPVQEDIQTIVSKGERKMYGRYSGGMNGLSAGGYGGSPVGANIRYVSSSGTLSGGHGGSPVGTNIRYVSSSDTLSGGYGGSPVGANIRYVSSSGTLSGGYGGGISVTKSSGGTIGGYGGGSILAKASSSGYGGQSQVITFPSSRYSEQSQVSVSSKGGYSVQPEDLSSGDENGSESSMYMQYGASPMVPFIRYY
jgi:hypothetical protein